LRSPIEKILKRHLEDIGNLLQAASTDPVSSLLVFLDLLKCQAKCIPEFLLAPTHRDATHANFTAHMLVSRVGCLFASRRTQRHIASLRIPRLFATRGIKRTRPNHAAWGSGLAPLIAHAALRLMRLRVTRLLLPMFLSLTPNNCSPILVTPKGVGHRVRQAHALGCPQSVIQRLYLDADQRIGCILRADECRLGASDGSGNTSPRLLLPDAPSGSPAEPRQVSTLRHGPAARRHGIPHAAIYH